MMILLKYDVLTCARRAKSLLRSAAAAVLPKRTFALNTDAHGAATYPRTGESDVRDTLAVAVVIICSFQDVDPCRGKLFIVHENEFRTRRRPSSQTCLYPHSE